MPTDELINLLNKRRGKVDGDGSTFESAPIESGSDFANLPRGQVQQVNTRGSNGSNEAMLASTRSNGDQPTPHQHVRSFASSTTEIERKNISDSFTSHQDSSNIKGSSLLRKRREEVDKAGETWESAPAVSSTDFISTHRHSSEGDFVPQSSTEGISSFVKDGDHSASRLIQKRREKVDAAGETWESAPVQSSTDFVAAPPKPLIKPGFSDEQTSACSVATLKGGDGSGPDMLRARREMVDAKAQVCESTPLASTTDAVAPIPVYRMDAQDSPHEIPATTPRQRVSTASLANSLPSINEDSAIASSLQMPESVERHRLATDSTCSESFASADEQEAYVPEIHIENSTSRRGTEDSFSTFGVEDDDEVRSLPSTKGDAYQSIIPLQASARKDQTQSVPFEYSTLVEPKMVSDEIAHSCGQESLSQEPLNSAQEDVNNVQQLSSIEAASTICKSSLENVNLDPTDACESITESDPMVQIEDAIGALRREKLEGKRDILTLSKYQASRTLILQLRYSMNGKIQNLATMNRFRLGGAYVQARSALASSLQNGRLQDRRACVSIERSAVERVATPSKSAPPDVTKACPTGDTRAWDTCLGARLRIGELNGAPRQISRICFGQPSSQRMAIATTDGGVLFCSTSEMAVVRELRAPRLDEISPSGASASDSVQALEFSPSDEMICLLCRGEVRLWRVSDGEILLTLGSKFTAIAFTPPTDGNVALACGDSQGNVQLIDCKALANSGLRCPGIVRRKADRSVVLVEEQTVSQFGRAVIAMTFEIPWARLFVADTFAKVHLLHRDGNTFAAESFVRFGNMVGIGESPQRVVSLRHVWRSTDFGKSRGAVLCLCWDKVVRLLAVGADEVTGGTQSQLQYVKAFSLAGTAWAAWRRLDGSGTCAHDALLRNVEITFLSLDVEPIAAAAWRQPMGGIAATIVTHEGGLQFLGQLTPPAGEKNDGPPPTSAPCGGGLLATDADGRSWASVSPSGSEVFLWRLHEKVTSVESKAAEVMTSKHLTSLIQEDFPAVLLRRKKGITMTEFLQSYAQTPHSRTTTECFDIADDSASDKNSNRRYSLEDSLQDFLGNYSSDDISDIYQGCMSSTEDEHQEQVHVGEVSTEMQKLLDMGFTPADARRALMLDEPGEPQPEAKPSPLATLHKSLEAALRAPSPSPERDSAVSPLQGSESSRSSSPQRAVVELHLPDYDPPEVAVDSPVAFSNNLADFIAGEEGGAPPSNVASERLTELLDNGPQMDLDQLQRCCEDAIGEMWGGARHDQK